MQLSRIWLALQGMTKELWDSALTAYHSLHSPEGLYKAWSWAHGREAGWKPSDPACYIATALAVTQLHSQPKEGQQESIASFVEGCNI